MIERKKIWSLMEVDDLQRLKDAIFYSHIEVPEDPNRDAMLEEIKTELEMRKNPHY